MCSFQGIFFFFPASGLIETCTNFLESVTQRLQLLLAGRILFQEPVKRTKKCVLRMRVSVEWHKPHRRSACACGV